MEQITVADIIHICNAKLIYGKEDTVCENFSKDTRQINPNDVYVGIRGENFNGSDFYEEALKRKASVCLLEPTKIDEEIIKKYPNSTILFTENTIEALQKLASYKRDLYNIPVVAITGSVGKTSTKDMIASVVQTSYKVLKTEGNLNNHIGLPLTILKLKDHEALVVEMGMSGFGEIRTLTKIAKPTICVITNVGTAHIGKLGSRENILKAKLEILEGMKSDGIVIINNDNDLLHKWQSEENKRNTYTFGIENSSNITAEDITLNEQTSEFMACINKEKYKIKVPVGGIHFIYNALSAIAVGLNLGITINNIIKGIEEFELSKNRMEIIKLKNGVTLINDCYNANFDSMKAGIESLSRMTKKRTIAVLGDMLELGEYSKTLHENVGEEVVKNNIDTLIVVGKEAKYIAKKAEEHGMDNSKIYELENTEEASKLIKKIMKSEDTILIKASNGMNFKNIVESLKNI